MRKATVKIVIIIMLMFAAGMFAGESMVKYDNTGKEASTVTSTAVKTDERTKIRKKADTENPTKITVTATAYCACEKCCGKSDGITATGTKATSGRTIAVDPSFISYGTEVVIDGHTYIAEDCGGAIDGKEIDIYFDTHKEALDFGRQQMTIYVAF